MTGVTELQKAILDLSETEYTELRRWLRDQDWERLGAGVQRGREGWKTRRSGC